MNKTKVHTCRAGQVPNKCPHINHIGELDKKSPMKHTVTDAIKAIDNIRTAFRRIKEDELPTEDVSAWCH